MAVRHQKKVWSSGAAVWLCAFIANLTVEGFTWQLSDFVVWAVLISAACALADWGSRGRSRRYQLAVLMTVATGFIMLWANLAVGLVGGEDNPLNLAFFAILAIGMAGALIYRGQARGLARTLGCMAAAQIIYGFWLYAAKDVSVIGATTVFSAVWLTAAVLFHRAQSP
jgi:hypothetical protein